MLDNMYWIFSFLKDKCDFLTLTAHLLEKNKQQRPKTLKFSNRGPRFWILLQLLSFFFLILLQRPTSQ